MHPFLIQIAQALPLLAGLAGAVYVNVYKQWDIESRIGVGCTLTALGWSWSFALWSGGDAGAAIGGALIGGMAGTGVASEAGAHRRRQRGR